MQSTALLHVSDWKWAVIAASAIVAVAGLVMLLLKPFGFENGIAWFLGILPGALVAYPVSDHVFKVAPRAEPLVFWTVLIGLNLCWYWMLVYIAIRIYRFIRRRATAKS